MLEAGGKRYLNFKEYAARRGVSGEAVSQAVRAGRISTHRIGSHDYILPEEADVSWAENTLQSNSRTREQQLGLNDGPTPASLSETSPEGDKTERPDQRGTFAKARAKSEVLKAQHLAVDLELKTGKLVRADEVATKAFADGRKIRNAIMAIPDRLAPIIAAETDVVKAHQLLTKELTETLRGVARELRESP